MEALYREGSSILQRVRPACSRTGLLPCRKENNLNVLVGRLELLDRGNKWDVGCMGAAAAAGALEHILPRHLLGWEGKAGGGESEDPAWGSERPGTRSLEQGRVPGQGPRAVRRHPRLPSVASDRAVGRAQTQDPPLALLCP